MLIAPTLFTTLAGAAQRKRQKPRTRPRQLPGQKGKAPTWRPLPTSSYKKKLKLLPAPKGRVVQDPGCCCFRYCDLLYQLKTPEEKLIWRKALKKRRLSPYDLWMSECLTLTHQRKHPPDTPSISGGWSTSSVIEGTTHPLAPCWSSMDLTYPMKAASAVKVKSDFLHAYTFYIYYAGSSPWPPPYGAVLRFLVFYTNPPRWWTYRLLHHTGFPLELRSDDEDLQPIFAIQQPYRPSPYVTACFDLNQAWTIQAPNYVPWGSYPPPPPPFPNP